MLGILATFTLLTLNPLKQIQKGQDAQREEDLKQLNNALDTYYDNNNTVNGITKSNCYPQSVDNIPQSGSPWTNGSSVYMKKVPNDPSAAGGWQNYSYITDGSTCPQWYALIAKMAIKATDPTETSTRCPLVNMTNGGKTCVPQTKFSPDTAYCVLSGSVRDCGPIQALSGNSMPTIAFAGATVAPAGPGASTPTPTTHPAPTSTPTPTPSGPTPTPCPCNTAFFQKSQDVSGNPTCEELHAAGPGQYCTRTGPNNNTCENLCQN
jgi:hypothetical protein